MRIAEARERKRARRESPERVFCGKVRYTSQPSSPSRRIVHSCNRRLRHLKHHASSTSPVGARTSGPGVMCSGCGEDHTEFPA